VAKKKKKKGIFYLESWGFFDLVLRSRRHAILGDLGGLGVRHDELGELVVLKLG
jgi:hypothetical protein